MSESEQILAELKRASATLAAKDALGTIVTSFAAGMVEGLGRVAAANARLDRVTYAALARVDAAALERHMTALGGSPQAADAAIAFLSMAEAQGDTADVLAAREGAIRVIEAGLTGAGDFIASNLEDTVVNHLRTFFQRQQDNVRAHEALRVRAEGLAGRPLQVPSRMPLEETLGQLVAELDPEQLRRDGAVHLGQVVRRG